jgi:hypothetical protein
VKGTCDYSDELLFLFLAIHVLNPSYKSQNIELNDLSSLDHGRFALDRFFIIKQNESSITMTVKDMESVDLSGHPLLCCSCATEMMAKIRALRNNEKAKLFLLDEPIAYQVKHYLDNYTDVTLGDIKTRRDYELATYMGWDVVQHCRHSHHAQFSDGISNKVKSGIQQNVFRSIDDKTRLTAVAPSPIPVPTPPIAMPPQPVTQEDILQMLNIPPREVSTIERQLSRIDRLRFNDLFERPIESVIDSCIRELFKEKMVLHQSEEMHQLMLPFD